MIRKLFCSLSKKGGQLKLGTLFSLLLLFVFGLSTVLITVLVDLSMRRMALMEAREKMNIILDQNLAVHAYFSEQLKPNLFNWSEPFQGEEYFDPTWMSSSYAIRELHAYAFMEGVGEYYYKDAVINARNPENEADAFEKAFLEEINKTGEMEGVSDVRTFGDEKMLVVLQPGEVLEESCLRCHGDPQDAPEGLVDLYGSERGFNRQENLGEVISAVSVRIPLTEAYAEADRLSGRITGGLLLFFTGLFLTLNSLQNKFLFNPLDRMRHKAEQISKDEDRLGENITLPFGKELHQMTYAFNLMSSRLRQSRDHLEERIKERTLELMQTNAQLQEEIVERRKLEAELRHQSTHDALTGVFNRQYYETEIDRLQYSRQFPVSIVMMDMDDLKGVNDRLGHQAGDELIRRAAQVFREVFRSEDMIARIGGDEFVAVLPETDEGTARQIVRRLEAALADHNGQNATRPGVQLSIGVATGKQGDQLTEVFKQADQAMYAQKEDNTIGKHAE